MHAARAGKTTWSVRALGLGLLFAVQLAALSAMKKHFAGINLSCMHGSMHDGESQLSWRLQLRLCSSGGGDYTTYAITNEFREFSLSFGSMLASGDIFKLYTFACTEELYE